MAKSSKHSPALFEVVHGKKHFDKTARESSLRTPSWWFKGRKRMSAIGALAPAGAETAVEDVPPFSDGDLPPSAADPTENPSIHADRDREREAERNRQAGRERYVDHGSDDAAPADPMAIPAALTASSRSRRRSAFQFVVDRDRHELFVRVRYTTAVVAGVSVLVVIALAYLSGRNVGRGPTSAMASATSEEIGAGPVDKGVLELPSRGSPNAPPANANVGGAAAKPLPARGPSAPTPQAATAAPNPQRPAGPSTEASPPPSAPPKNLTRTIGLNYVIVQGYPEVEKETAVQACDALNKAGVPCTVEKGVIGWNGGWYYVVGAEGFARTGVPEYAHHVTAIERVSEKFAGKSRFKRFEPTATKWRGTAN